MRSLLLLALTIPVAASAQVRQLRAVPDPAFDASALELNSPPTLRVDRELRVFVADRQSTTLSRLSADGRQSEVLVKEGAGPGEARGIFSLSWLADTLWFSDPRLSRFTQLDRDGTFIRTIVPTERCLNSFGGSLLQGDACLEGMSFTSVTTRNPSNPVTIASLKHTRVDTVGNLGYGHTTMELPGPNASIFGAQRFADDGYFTPMSDGKAVLQVQRGAATSAGTDSVLLRRRALTGDWSAWTAVRYTPLLLLDRAFDSVLTAQAEQIGKGAPWVTFDAIKAKSYRPKFYPPAPVILAASGGAVWVKLIHAKAVPGTTTWVVLDEMLAERSRVVAPAGLTILDARGEYCWGYILDQDDVPQVVRYQLVAAK